MAIADVYDALTSNRVYKTAMPHKQAVEIILQGRGTHFDPDAGDVFAALEDSFRDIGEVYSDDRD